MPLESPTRFTMVPARRSTEPVARRRARWILICLLLAASLSVVAIGTAVIRGKATTDLSGVDPRGRDLAYAAAAGYLAGGPPDVPHATSFDPGDAAPATGGAGGTGALPYRSLTWTGFSVERFGSGRSGVTLFEVHHFLVVLDTAASMSPASPASPGQAVPGRNASGQAVPGSTVTPAAAPPAQVSVPIATPSAAGPAGSPSPSAGLPAQDVLQLDVTVLLTPAGPRLAAAPAFSVWAGGAGGAAGVGDYTNYNTLVTEVSDQVKGQVARWATAYAGGDSATLLALTGDQNTRHRYLGLSGFTLPDEGDAVRVLSAIKVAQGELVVRVRILLARTAEDGTVPVGGSPQFAAFADFDLLVGAPAGASPPILAWGPAGSAADLQPYSNALLS